MKDILTIILGLLATFILFIPVIMFLNWAMPSKYYVVFCKYLVKLKGKTTYEGNLLQHRREDGVWGKAPLNIRDTIAYLKDMLLKQEIQKFKDANGDLSLSSINETCSKYTIELVMTNFKEVDKSYIKVNCPEIKI